MDAPGLDPLDAPDRDRRPGRAGRAPGDGWDGSPPADGEARHERSGGRSGPSTRSGRPKASTSPRPKAGATVRAAKTKSGPAGGGSSKAVKIGGDDEDGTRRGRGWVGPIVVAALVSLIGIGFYVLHARGDGGHAKAAPRPTTTLTPATTNPDAANGLMMINGTYRCWKSPENSSAPIALPDKLVVPNQRGVYIWNGVQGAYTIKKSSLSIPTKVYSDVTFTTGTLTGIKITIVANVEPDGVDSGSVFFQDNSARLCAVN